MPSLTGNGSLGLLLVVPPFDAGVWQKEITCWKITDNEGVVINFEIYFRWSCFVQMMYGSDQRAVIWEHHCTIRIMAIWIWQHNFKVQSWAGLMTDVPKILNSIYYIMGLHACMHAWTIYLWIINLIMCMHVTNTANVCGFVLALLCFEGFGMRWLPIFLH